MKTLVRILIAALCATCLCARAASCGQMAEGGDIVSKDHWVLVMPPSADDGGKKVIVVSAPRRAWLVQPQEYLGAPLQLLTKSEIVGATFYDGPACSLALAEMRESATGNALDENLAELRMTTKQKALHEKNAAYLDWTAIQIALVHSKCECSDGGEDFRRGFASDPQTEIERGRVR